VLHGTQIRAGEVHEGEELQILGDGPIATLSLYTAASPTSQWVNDAGLVRIGAVVLHATPGDQTRVDLSFGALEIRATIINKTAGTAVPASIQYDFRRLAAGQ
jgi:hypothetical protein